MDLLCCVMDDSGATSHIAPSLCELYINGTMNGGRTKDNVFQISSTKGKNVVNASDCAAIMPARAGDPSAWKRQN